MPKTNFKPCSALLDLLCEYASSNMTTDEFSERMDQLAEYQNSVRSEVDNYYLGIE